MTETPGDPHIEIPETRVDTDPEANANPGGADAVPEDDGKLVPLTRDHPPSAQIHDREIPDEIQEPEASDEGTGNEGKGDDESADVAAPSS